MNSSPTRWMVLFSLSIGLLFIGAFALVVSGLAAPWLDWD